MNDLYFKLINREKKYKKVVRNINYELSLDDNSIINLFEESSISNIDQLKIEIAGNIKALALNFEKFHVKSFELSPHDDNSYQVNTIKLENLDDVTIKDGHIDNLCFDCKSILISNCIVNEFKIGMIYHTRILNEDNSDALNSYSANGIDIRSCKIYELKGFVSADMFNIQDSKILFLHLRGTMFKECRAVIHNLNIWQYSEINELIINCEIENCNVEGSLIHLIFAEDGCFLGKLTFNNFEITNAYQFDEHNFDCNCIIKWQLIQKSAINNGDRKLAANAGYEISKELYNKESKKFNKLEAKLFDLCSGYGYKPIRIYMSFSILILFSSILLSIIYACAPTCIHQKMVTSNIFYESVLRSVAAIVGQSGITIKDGIAFAIVVVEYIISVILFAIYVNALYVRYKD